jgi:hypothetical protein
MKTMLFTAALLGCALLSGAAGAQTAQPAAADVESAKVAYGEGKALRDNHDLPGALARFKAAYALVPTPITALEVGRTLLAMGQPADALDVLVGIEKMPSNSGESEKAAEARVEAAQLASDARSKVSAESGEKTGFGVSFGAKAGGIVPLGGLSPWAQFGVEAGVVFPWLRRGISLGLHVDYAQPTSDGTQAGDPRVAGGSYTWNLTQQYLTFMPVVMYRHTGFGRVVPFAGVGPRIYLMRSTVSGAVGSVGIPETTEQSTALGVGVPFGVELKVGPGGVLGEVLAQWGPFEHAATGPTHTGALSLSVGYRFTL